MQLARDCPCSGRELVPEGAFRLTGSHTRKKGQGGPLHAVKGGRASPVRYCLVGEDLGTRLEINRPPRHGPLDLPPENWSRGKVILSEN